MHILSQNSFYCHQLITSFAYSSIFFHLLYGKELPVATIELILLLGMVRLKGL